jgi:hypothetical protein
MPLFKGGSDPALRPDLSGKPYAETGTPAAKSLASRFFHDQTPGFSRLVLELAANFTLV